MPDAGRIQTYTHSDRITENKGASMVRVLCVSDFGANTPQFREFCELVAKRAYAHQSMDFEALCAADNEVKEQWTATELVLCEKITVDIVAVEQL